MLPLPLEGMHPLWILVYAHKIKKTLKINSLFYHKHDRNTLTYKIINLLTSTKGISDRQTGGHNYIWSGFAD